MTHLVVIGDTVVDRDVHGRVERVCPDAPALVIDEVSTHARPGGAGLAAALLSGDGHQVTLVTAVGDDGAGAELRTLLDAARVEVVDLGLAGPTPEKIRVRAEGQSLLRIDRGGAPSPVGTPPAGAIDVVSSTPAVLVADYGRGVARVPAVRALLEVVARRSAVVWDPHPRGGAPISGVRLLTPNRDELARFEPGGDRSVGSVTVRARALLRRWQAKAVAVTGGAEGAVLVDGEGTPLIVPASRVHGRDACGAGDRFASAAAALLAEGALPSEAVVGAVALASAFVAAGGAEALSAREAGADSAPAGMLDAVALAAEVRARGGTVVATGGCFDLLHAGHVSLLDAARSLGDCLIVCLNSDDSVRRLKGPGRPVVPAADRAAVLLALGCVDAVLVFDEDTPAAALERLRPHFFAKGGDYAGTELPEAQALAAWGGQAVVLPYLDGRSTTTMLREAATTSVSR